MARISGPFAFRSQPRADASPYTQINCLQNPLGGSARTPQPFGRCRLGSRNVVSEVWPSCSPNTTIRRCRPNVLNNSRAVWNRPPDRARPTRMEGNAAAATSLLRLRCRGVHVRISGSSMVKEHGASAILSRIPRMQDFVSNSLAQKLWISSSGVDGVPVGSGATLRKAFGIKHHLEIGQTKSRSTLSQTGRR
jgi:hypothetical protein